MLNINTSTLEWLEGESLDGKKLTPEEQSQRAKESLGAYGMLVLTAVGLRIPGGGTAARSMAGRSLGYRIMNAPILGSIIGGARGGGAALVSSRLGQAVLRNPRVIALQARLGRIQTALATQGIGSSRAARSASKAYYVRVRNRLFQEAPNRIRPNNAFPRGREGEEFHHWLIPQRATWAPNWLKHSRLNLMRVRATQHAKIDPSRFQFIPNAFRGTPEFAPYGLYGRLWHGTPVIVRSASGGTIVVYIYVQLKK